MMSKESWNKYISIFNDFDEVISTLKHSIKCIMYSD